MKYLSGFLFLFLSLFFSPKLLLTMMTGYNSFSHPTATNIFELVFLFSWSLFGFCNTLFYTIISYVTLSIAFRNELKMFVTEIMGYLFLSLDLLLEDDEKYKKLKNILTENYKNYQSFVNGEFLKNLSDFCSKSQPMLDEFDNYLKNVCLLLLDSSRNLPYLSALFKKYDEYCELSKNIKLPKSFIEDFNKSKNILPKSDLNEIEQIIPKPDMEKLKMMNEKMFDPKEMKNFEEFMKMMSNLKECDKLLDEQLNLIKEIEPEEQ